MESEAPPLVLVVTTAPSDEVAANIARAVVAQGLAACGNIVPGVRSIYQWQGALCDDSEVMVVFKTLPEAVPQLRDAIVALHPYECPEVVATPASFVSAPYLQWVRENVRLGG